MTKKQERDENPIDQIEGDDLLDGDLLPPDDLPKPPPISGDENPWADSKREEDEYSDSDGASRTRIYTLTIPNDDEAKGYGHLCLDTKNFSLAPQKSFECVVIYRIKPNIMNVPFNESRGLKSYERTTGYSLTGKHPTPDSQGNFCPECLNSDDVPFFQCSITPPYTKDKKTTPLSIESGVIPGTKIKGVGECPKGRWGNTLPAKVRKEYGIRSERAKPMCDKHIILFAWHLDYDVLFNGYFKRTSLPFATEFLASCTRGMGDDATQYPFHAFIARIEVEKVESYFIPKIINTNKWSDRRKIEPIVEYFKENKSRFVRNMMLVWEEMKNKDAKAEEFPPED